MLTFKSFGAKSKILPDLQADDLLTNVLCSKSVCEQNITGNNFPIENVLYTVQDKTGLKTKNFNTGYLCF